MDTYVDYVENKLDTLEKTLTVSDRREQKLKRDLLLARLAFAAMTVILLIVFSLWVKEGTKKAELSSANSALTHQLYTLEMEINGYLAEIDEIHTTLYENELLYTTQTQALVATYEGLIRKIISAYSSEVSAYMTENVALKIKNDTLFAENTQLQATLDEFNEAFGKKIRANATSPLYKTAQAYTLTPLGTFSATGYSIYECPNQLGITASGRKVKTDVTIAVDTSVIPHGSWVYIEGYGLRRADDTGGAIQGNDIDIFHDSYEDALAFGRKNLRVWLVNPQTGPSRPV